MIPFYLLQTTNTTMDFLSNYLSGISAVFGPNLFGVIFILFFVGLLIKQNASLDLIAAIMIPVIFVGGQLKIIPGVLSMITLAACALIIVYAFRQGITR